VISESIDKLIPDRVEHSDQERFTQGNPYIIHDKIPAEKAFKRQVLGTPD